MTVYILIRYLQNKEVIKVYATLVRAEEDKALLEKVSTEASYLIESHALYDYKEGK